MAVPLVIKKFTKVVIRRMHRIMGMPVKPMLFRKLAEETAIIIPRLVKLKMAIN